MNLLYFGDNLDVLQQEIPAERVDLIYLDPPFNSKRGYNILYKSPKGRSSKAQVMAFKDTWVWGEQSEREFQDILRAPNTDVAEMMEAMRRFLNESDMMAYLTMMARRLLELHRVLKPTGSFYLHCDPTASHYLKLLLDALFGPANFRAEINWRRTSAHSDTRQGRKQYGNVRDVIFYYTKSDNWTWNPVYTPYDETYIENFYRYTEEDTGRRYRLSDMTGPGGAAKGNPSYEVMGVTRYWRYSQEKMEQLIAEGRVVQTRPGAVPAYKRYLDEMPGVPLQNDWQDIQPVAGKERLGYPTQKPRELLERIIQVSSNPGDVVLDPFCGCGTTVHAAEKLNRQWIGIDITHLAITLIEKRLRDAFPSIKIEVEGTPKDVAGARDLARRDKYQFEWWACSLVDAQPYQGKKKGADSGIDGLIFFTDVVDNKPVSQKIVVSVKGGERVGVGMIRELIATVENNQAAIGLFVTLAEPTRPMITEAAKAGFYTAANGKDYPRIQILTIKDLLTERKRPEYVDFDLGAGTFHKAEAEKPQANQERLL